MKNKIVINLQESSNAKEFDSGNLIHQTEYDRVIELINSRIDRASSQKDSDKDKNSKPRYNDTISILGSRGSGKTSFLLSLLKHYKPNNDNDNEKDKNKDNIEVLDIIDPTLIEEKGHVFLTIISLIEESVCKKLKLNDCSTNDAIYYQKKDWKDKLRKLADGLPSMDGVGLGMDDTNWQDSEFIMDKGLKSVKAAKDLEANFNDLVAYALKILGKEAFIVTLDDIDVDFRKGWPVLETIRKYLTSPQIIVLLSGDLKLYSKAVRKQQWKNFGKALLVNEVDKLQKEHEYNDLVTELENQYLLKVIKPENRIRLTTLYEKIELSKELNEEICIKNRKNSNIEIKSFYNDKVLAIFGIHNKYQVEAYTSFLLNLPIRTQIQFLSEIKDTEDANMPETSNVIDAFLSDLYEKDVDIDLARNLPKMLDVVILKLLIKEQVLSNAYQLQPTTTDPSLNSSLIALSFLFSKKIKSNPYLIFDYLIKIGYVQNLLKSIGYAEKDDRRGKALLKPSIEGLCNHSGIFQDKVLRDVVGNMTAYIESLPNGSENKNGIIHLFATAKKEKGSNEESRGRIDYEFRVGDKQTTTLQQTLAFIPLSTSEFIEKNQSISTYSIYTLLGTVGELIRKTELNDLGNGLLELSQWRTYPMVSFEKGIANLKDENNYDEIEFKDDSTNSVLINLIKDWRLDFSRMKKMYSPHLIGKISTRIYSAFDAIKNDQNLGIAMHRRLIALMNAILIEDVRENSESSQGLNINNAVTSNKIFISNLKFANSLKKDLNLSFSKWMLRCPLFLLYLDKQILNEESLINFIFPGKKEHIQPFIDNTIYDKLEHVYTKETTTMSNQASIEKISFSIDRNNIESIAEVLKKNGLDYKTFEGIILKDFNKNYSYLFNNKVNTNSLTEFKVRAKEKVEKGELEWK